MKNIVVIGTGGNGQTYFMKYLKDNGFNINNIGDYDGIKHLSCPTRIPRKIKDQKFIYIYNSSFDAICSHYRRDWSFIQIKKINDPSYKISKEKINTIENYFDLVDNTVKDWFGIENHFKRWYKYSLNNKLDIYFLDFKKVKQEKNRLSKFLNCDSNIFNSFDIKNRDKYKDLKSTHIISDTMYTIIDDYINKKSEYYNSIY